MTPAARCGAVTRRAFLRALAAAGLVGRRGRAARLLALDPVSISRTADWAG